MLFPSFPFANGSVFRPHKKKEKKEKEKKEEFELDLTCFLGKLFLLGFNKTKSKS